MSTILILFGVTIFAATGLALLTKRYQVAAAVLLAVLLATSGAAFETLLSRPKPIALEVLLRLHPAQIERKVEVLGYSFDEGTAIYVMVQRDTPRLYSLPWSEEAAQQLQDATQAAEGQGTAVLMRFRAHDDDTDEPVFYALPQQQARPDKPPTPRP